MPINMKGRSLLTLKDLSTNEIRFLLDEALKFKKNRAQVVRDQPLRGKTLGMIFQKIPLPFQVHQLNLIAFPVVSIHNTHKLHVN